MDKNALNEKIERGPEYFRVGASFIVEQVAHMDGLENGSLRLRLMGIAARIHERTFEEYDIRSLKMFRKSSRVLERSGLLSRSLKTVIWQMQHDMWLDEYVENGAAPSNMEEPPAQH